MVPSEATKDEVLQLGAKWDPEVGSEVNATTDASRSWFSAVFSDRVFSFLVVCILWANLFRCAIYVGGRETVDTFHVVACGSWYFMSASTCTVMFVTCAKKSYFREFFWKWGTIYTDPVTKQLGLHGVITTGFTKWVIAFQWGAILFNLFAIASIMIFSDYLFTDGMSKIFYITGQRSIPWLIASILVHFFVSCSWLSPTAFIVVMCHHIVQHFEALNMVIKLHVGAAKSRFPQHLALLRERHLAMCETVEVMDRCISKLSIFIYGTTIGLCCFNVYYVFTGTLDKSLIPVFLFWFFSNFGIMTLVTYHTSNVNVAMHSVGSYLHLIQTKDLTPDQLGQLQMFLFKTTGPSMGFTVLGMVTVTKELMMTLIGALLTYTVILLQFN